MSDNSDDLILSESSTSRRDPEASKVPMDQSTKFLIEITEAPNPNLYEEPARADEEIGSVSGISIIDMVRGAKKGNSYKSSQLSKAGSFNAKQSLNHEGVSNEGSNEGSRHSYSSGSNDFSEDSSEVSDSSSELSESRVHETDHDFEILVHRRQSKKDNSIKAARANRLREETLGLSTSPHEVNYVHMKMLIKNHKDLTVRILKRYREIDNKEYKLFIRRQVYDEEVQRVFNQFYLLNHKYAECALVFFINSYEETGIVRLFESFFLEFDMNGDTKLQIRELEKCMEYLSKEDFVGRDKMIVSLKELEVYSENSLNYFQEGDESKKVLNSETMNRLFEKFKYKDYRKKLHKSMEHVDFHKLAPVFSIFFFEYIIKLFLLKRDSYQFHLGFPYKSNKKGKFCYDSSQEPTGLFRVFVSLLKGEKDIKKPVVSFAHVSSALIKYRASGFSEALPTDSIERIVKEAKEFMGVDLISQKERRLYSMKEILPFLAAKVATEISWNTHKVRKSIENYDSMVYWLGGALCNNLKKKKLDKMLKEAFCYLQTPTFDQFVKGLDYILHRVVPTIVSPAAIYIAKSLMKTPDAVILTEDITGKTIIKFNIDYIIKEDNLFERLYYFSMRFQVKLIYVRLLYKHHYSTYRRETEINRTIHEYNDIIQNPMLFEDIIPGNFGNFTDSSLSLIKTDDPEDLEKEELTRREMKIRNFFEKLAHKEVISKHRKSNKRFGSTIPILKHLNTIDKRKKKAFKLSQIKKLQAEANVIDGKVNLKELEKMKVVKKTKESSAFPNTPDVTPDILMNFIKNANSKSNTVKKLERFIYRGKEKINFQDIHKFLVSEELLRINKTTSKEMEKSKTLYAVKNIQEEIDEDLKDMEKKNAMNYIDDGPQESFEDIYFKEVSRRRSAYMKISSTENANGAPNRLRGCCCTIS